MIGVGLDVVDVERFRAALARTPGLIDRLFTAGEAAYAAAAADPAERYAVRFAAKEAVLKALGLGLGAVGWHDIEVVRAPSGAPSLVLTGRALRAAEDAGVARWHLSLSHTATVAQAIAIAE